jgi:hypothetical protein
MAWMVACLLAVFVSTPLLDTVMCRGEALNGAVAAGMADLVAVDDHRDGAASATVNPGGHTDDGGLSVCLHGHCHQGGVAKAVATPEVSRVRLTGDAGVPAAAAVLHSADLTHAKPPPRA